MTDPHYGDPADYVFRRDPTFEGQPVELHSTLQPPLNKEEAEALTEFSTVLSMHILDWGPDPHDWPARGPVHQNLLAAGEKLVTVIRNAERSRRP